jgi:hypothetical protein
MDRSTGSRVVGHQAQNASMGFMALLADGVVVTGSQGRINSHPMRIMSRSIEPSPDTAALPSLSCRDC